MSDLVTSYIRTWVPIVVGPVLVWLSTVLGADFSEWEGTLVGFLIALVSAVYYAIVRWAEQKWPWVGKLLGKQAAPTYSE